MNCSDHRWNGTALLGLAITLACVSDLSAVTSTKLSNRAKSPESVEQLPSYVPAAAGEVTLFADYDDVRGDRVVLYLVNRTDRRLGFFAQDDDVYAKLEVENDDGRWERAQVHRSSWCGNSYTHNPSLRPDEFFRFLGYFPSEGEPSVVRYRIYSEAAIILTDESPEYAFFGARNAEKMSLNLVSNTGFGQVKATDVAETHRDSWAVRHGSFATIRELALGVSEPSDEDCHLRWDAPRRSTAIEALRRFPTKEATAVLETLLEDDAESIRHSAIHGLAIIGPQCSEAETRFQQLLKDENVTRRTVAISALADRPVTVDVIQEMQQLLEHEEPMFRSAAVAVLMRSCRKVPQAHAVLATYKSDPDPQVQKLLDIIEKFGWCPSSEPGTVDE